MNEQPEGVEIIEGVQIIEEVAEFALPLEEFCARLSASDRRVELIGGFHYAEKAAGRLMDTETAYKSRLMKFVGELA